MDYLNNLKEVFYTNANPDLAIGMEKYMRNKFQYLGLRSEARKELQKPIFNSLKSSDFSIISEFVNALWKESQREFQYAACELLRIHSKKIPIDYINQFEFFITDKSWWDTVDSIAPSSLGDYFKNYSEQIPIYIPNWISSENIWLQRAAILFQLKYKTKTNEPLLFSIIQQLSTGKEFFVNKAIGWALREYSKTNPISVIDFVNENELSVLSKKEALKVINKTNKL